MGRKREVFGRLMTKPLAEVRVEYLMHALGEIASGTRAFGHLDEWDRWFRYLLPDLILRGHEVYAFARLLQPTVTAFMAVFWQGVESEYPRCREDVLCSLPISLMRPELWALNPEAPNDATKSSPLFLLEEHEGRLFVEWWGLTKAHPDLSAALIFCLKYLRPGEIPAWVDSLVRIEHPHWRAALLVWLAGARRLFTAELPLPSDIEASAPEIGWEWSHVLGSPGRSADSAYPPVQGFNANDDFLSPANARAFWREVRHHLGGTLTAWEAQLWSDPRLASIRGLPEMLDRIARDVAA